MMASFCLFWLLAYHPCKSFSKLVFPKRESDTEPKWLEVYIVLSKSLFAIKQLPLVMYVLYSRSSKVSIHHGALYFNTKNK